jgi:hypothetical protein
MKTLKNSKQKSSAIAMDMYTNEQYIEMSKNEEGIFYICLGFGAISDIEEYDGEDLRINHSSVAEIKVVYNREFDEYMNVVKTYSSNTYYVTL